MADINRQVATLASNLWENFIKFRMKNELSSHLSYYRAMVIGNNGDGTLTVKEPFDEPSVVACTNDMANVGVGTQVIVMCFGKGNADNQVVVARGDGRENKYVTITTTSNLDDITLYGTYVLLDEVAAGSTNTPTGNGGTLTVIDICGQNSFDAKLDAYSIQMFLDKNGEMHIRSGVSDGTNLVWGEWKTTPTNENVIRLAHTTSATIEVSQNLDNYTTGGIFRLWGAYTNAPTPSFYGTLEVIRCSNYVVQIAISVPRDEGDTIRVYYRRRNVSTWSSWQTTVYGIELVNEVVEAEVDAMLNDVLST